MALVEDVNYASIDAATVEVGPLIGSGEFAKVYLGRLGDGARVAVKRQVAPSEEECDEAAQVARALGLELRILASVDHANVLRYVGCWEDVGRPSVGGRVVPGTGLNVVTEYAAGGDVRTAHARGQGKG